MVKINIRPSDKCMGQKSLFISFDFSYTILDIIKALPSRVYNPATYEWEVPSLLLDKVRKQFIDNKIDFRIYGLELLSDTKVNYNYDFKTKPLNHQLECVDYGLKHNSFLIGDEMGLGKTKEALDISCIRKSMNQVKKVLIICGDNSLKFNWLNEIRKHTNEYGWILGMRKNKKGKYKIGSTSDKITDLSNLCGDCFYMITNIESFRNNDFIKELSKQIHNIDMVILDEAHKCKNPKAQQTKGFIKYTKTKYMIAMSGTFMLNRPVDLFVPLSWIGYYKDSYWKFENSFLVKDDWGNICGIKNTDLLQNMVRDCMLRRRKVDVLDLPEKTYINEYIEMTDAQQEIYDEVIRGLRENIDKIRLSPNPLVETIRARQATGFPGILTTSCNESAKMNRLEELVEQISINGNKCLVFSNWAEMVEVAYKTLSKFNPQIITGNYNEIHNESAKEIFKTNPDCKVICGTIGKMGTGFTLTEANYVIFLDEPWNKGLKEQASDRTHRIGQTKNVTIITLLCKDTIDEKINALVEQKGLMSDMIVDGKVIAPNKLADFLLY